MYNILKCARAGLCRIQPSQVESLREIPIFQIIRALNTATVAKIKVSNSTLNDFGLPESKEFFVPGISPDPFYKDISLPKRCIGCGAHFQVSDPNKPGYVDSNILNESGARGSSKLPSIRGIEVEAAPEGVEVDRSESGKFSTKKRRVVCKRCYKLQYYKRLDSQSEVDSQRETLTKELLESENSKRDSIKRVISGANNLKRFPVLITPEELEASRIKNSLKISSTSEIISNMATRIKNDSLILFIVDLTNLEVSVIPELYIALRNRALDVIWIANKLDVLPKGCEASEIKSWLRSVVRHIGNSKSSNVIPVSSSKGIGFDHLEARFKEYLKVGDPRNIYVVGATNVGKSTFVDRFLDYIHYKHVGTLNLRRSVGGATRSAIPGTTLEFIEFGLPNGFKLVDTPGIPIISQLSSLLYKPVDLLSISLTKTINPVCIKMEEGKSLLIGGVARVDHVEGSSCTIQCYFGNGVTMKVCRSVASEDIMNYQVGYKLYPPHSKEDYKRLMPFSKYRVTVNCNGKGALDEFVICGLGWFSRPAMISSPPRRIDKPNFINRRGRIKSIMKLRNSMIKESNAP
ncbi:GTPase [Theileria orientalis]|uniref:GTPase n=1 Tax=Theileria orientalis TaxID=68886 RepID=A0A976M3F6_THEOR|nr:GTPase [Theileria orientalis]